MSGRANTAFRICSNIWPSRAPGGARARAIAEEIETAGGDLNAATSIEHTAYYAHVLAEDAPLALDILADILTDSIFDTDELEREKDVILQEIGAVEDTPDDLVFDLFNAAAFPDQPIGRPILGTPEQMRALRAATSIGVYLERHYSSGATVIGAAGAIDHERVCDEAERRFRALARRTRRRIRAAGALSRRRTAR